MARAASVLFLAIIPVLSVSHPARAESVDAFLSRVRQAYAAADRTAALKEQFYLEGMDAESLAMYDRLIFRRMLDKYDNPSLAVEALPEDFDPLQVAGGYEYRPNLKPLGYVVIGGRTRALYGRHGDRYYFTGVTRTRIANPAGPERMLQMIVMGMAHPAIEFDGYCEVTLANRDRKRVRLNDEGLTSKTMLVTGVRIESCEVRNLSGRGSLMLRLLEGEDQIFDRQVDSPQHEISFTR